ncbi:hypothetical protein VTK73DRAFT_7705 [Phialemonium thermophilum]|uniref:Histidine kinase n=1 Tax=Phialemonium thermophilum TaxID=223376 RepID=A0ABR3XSC5_9PEZI
MWKDGSVAFPNRAAQKLFKKDADIDKCLDGFDILSAWELWDEEFTRQLSTDEFPISQLIRTEEPFSGRRVGMYDPEGKRLVFEVSGEVIRDDVTGDVLVGVVTAQDVTDVANMITQIKRQDDERFRLICDTMPQLVWTATPDGMHDFYNTRWYKYTGLTEAETLGVGWKSAFHPDDLVESDKLWEHSLRTGEPYVVEYRCRSKEGQWKWFIGRALPLRNKQTGQIEKWFGTCTDANESIETRLIAKQTQQQLLSVIAHSHVTIFTVDLDRKITMLEGALIWDTLGEDADHTSGVDSPWYIGKNVYEVFNHLNSQLPHGQRPQFLEPIEAILAGEPTVDLQEHEIDGNFYRTRFLPVHAKRENGLDAASPEGVIGVILDVTELKTKEADIEAQAREKQELVANEAAAKEASRLKSQFLANMSHEIRTPITGVLGMAELLLDLELGQEQREYTENIYRSASALLTVINDILDLSKVESGRLDIEEVPFSLSVIVGDVSKMLSFAAQRKNLFFQADIPWDVESDLVVMGDPGRVRQIITNILTNSIKFTNQGSVKFTVVKEKETTDMVEMKFVIEDTGIGIEDAVRDRLFQPFSQGDASTARKFGGTGLGLAICKNLLELMNGRITLESTLGAGTTASFWIPFNKPQASHQTDLVHINPLPDRLQSEMSLSCNSSEYEHGSPTLGGELPVASMEKSRASWQRKSMMSNIGVPPLPPEEYLGPSERSRINVFVVEDNAINQQIATKTIRKLGFNVNAAWNGREALDYLMAAKEGKHAKPDIILMDVQMPIIDGYKCTHLLRHHLPYKTYVDDIPIVAMTASAIQGDREKCWKAGMDDYLAKPVKSKTLEKMLVRWTITGRRPTSYPTQASDVFECQEENGHCDKAGIPAPGPDEYERNGAFSATTQAAVAPSLPLSSLNSALVHNSTDQGTVVKTGENTGEKDSAARAFPVPSLPTLDEMAAVPNTVPETVDDSAPRPPTFKGDSLTQALRFTDPDELAIQSRDDKLLGAAGASTTLPSSHHHHSLPHSLLQPAQSTGEALTEENIEKLEKGASKWRS